MSLPRSDLVRLKNRIDTVLDAILSDMKPGWDDSIHGFNKAWDVVREIFEEELGESVREE